MKAKSVKTFHSFSDLAKHFNATPLAPRRVAGPVQPALKQPVLTAHERLRRMGGVRR